MISGIVLSDWNDKEKVENFQPFMEPNDLQRFPTNWIRNLEPNARRCAFQSLVEMRPPFAHETFKKGRRKSNSATTQHYSSAFSKTLIMPPNIVRFAFGILLISVFLQAAASKRVILLDSTSTTQSELKWETFSLPTSDGWLEESYIDEGSEGANFRSYVVCEVNRDNVDNWLRTPYIPFEAANRVYVEITFSMRDCHEFPRHLRTCRESFTVLYHESDAEPGKEVSPPWRIGEGAFTAHQQRVTGDVAKFSASEGQATQKSVETRSVPVSKKGIFFAFRDDGTCTSILGVKVYYEVCEETVHNFAWFDRTSAGQDAASFSSVVGRCVNHAKPIGPNPPKYHCKVDGTWDIPNGGCVCNPGYWADGQKCLPCNPGTYSLPSSDKSTCSPCPPNSNAIHTGSEVCECDAGYYRAEIDELSAPCTRPPSRPLNLKVESKNYTSVVLVWQRPESDGGRQELWYRVHCALCPPSTHYDPNTPERFNTTRISLTGLEAGTDYAVMIFAENAVSKRSQSMYAVSDFQTRPISRLEVRNFHIKRITESLVSLAWEAPLRSEDNTAGNPPQRFVALGSGDTNPPLATAPVDFYQIRKMTSANINDHINVTATYYTFRDLAPGQQYGFQIRAYALGSFGSWSSVVQATTPIRNSVLFGDDGGVSTEKPSGSDTLSQTAMWAALISLFFMIILVVVICLVCRYKDDASCRRKQPSDLDVLDYKHGGALTPDYPQYRNGGGQMPVNLLHGRMTAPLMSNMSPHISTGVKPYVDPLTYEDPNMALQDFAFEIDPDYVYINEIIGAGEFGEVCKGELKSSARLPQIVAIKTLRKGATMKARKDFLMEASIMGQFDHPNVISLRGVVTQTEPVMIITEFMENGSLDKFLKARDGKMNVLDLIGMMRDIASGMKYLSDKQFVHRDLAARNVLVGAECNCKISDFGLSRGMEGSTEQVYTTQGGKIPVRWTAPEAISYRKFTTASDVWSFGVLMWEVMSYGERPYGDWSNQTVIAALENGYRLQPPSGPGYKCPSGLYAVMLECWQADKVRRPTFDILLQQLYDFLRYPSRLENTPDSSPPSSMSTPLDISHSPVNIPSLPIHSPDSQLDLFLARIGSAHCYEPLVANGVVSLAQLSVLTLVDLMNYGLTQSDAAAILDSFRHHQHSSSTLPRNRSSPSDHHFANGYRTVGRNNPPHHRQNEGFFV